jgi:chromosome partitioning protein
MRRLKVVAVAQRKGGPGKTTLSRTALESYGIYRNLQREVGSAVWRALGIDFDGQCNLSQLLLKMDTSLRGIIRPPVHPQYNAANPEGLDKYNGRSSSALIFAPTPPMPYGITTLKGIDTIDILPGDNQLLRWLEEREHSALEKEIVEQCRKWFIGNDEVLSKTYDLAVIDTAPANSPLTRAALRAATHLLIPIELEQQCIDGLHEMLGMWREENKRRSQDDRLEILLIQPNRVKMKRAGHQEFLEELRRNPNVKPYLAEDQIPDLAEFAERDVVGSMPRSVFQLGPASKARQAAVKFAEEIHKRLFGADAQPAPKELEDVELA